MYKKEGPFGFGSSISDRPGNLGRPWRPASVPSVTVVGIVLGGLGVALGARRLGIAAIVVSVAVLLFGLAAINGLIPGLDPPGYEQQAPEG